MFYSIAIIVLLLSAVPAFSQGKAAQESREERAIEDLISDFETHLHLYYLLALGSLHETYATGIIPVKKDVYVHQTVFLAKEIGSREIEYRKELPQTYNFFKDFGSFHSICIRLIFNYTEFDAEHKAYCSGTSSRYSYSNSRYNSQYTSRGWNTQRKSSYYSGRQHNAGRDDSLSGSICNMAENPRNYTLVSYEHRKSSREKRFRKYLENIQMMYAYKKRVEHDIELLKEAVQKKRAHSTP